jgi:phage shock protein E
MKRLFGILIFAASVTACSKPEETAEIISPATFADELKSDPAIILLDVRTSEEIQKGYLQGARQIDFNSPGFAHSLDSLDHSKAYLVYCASGKRSGKALTMMKEKGFQHVKALEGGLNAWTAAGLPVNRK